MLQEIYEKFEKFELVGSRAMEIMREKSFSPQQTKILRSWTLTEVANMVQKSTKTIREHEKKLLLPKPNIINNKRQYSLRDINIIREHFKITPHKNPQVPPAIIAFTNFKGGVAKTTGAIHAAQYFARTGYKVLLIDADSQASTTSSFGYAPDEHIKEKQTLLSFFLGQNQSLKSIIMQTYWDNLDLIPANLKLYEIELELPTIRDRALNSGKTFNIHNILYGGLQQIYNIYDIVIIDCPPSMSILNTNALFAANSLIIPCPPELPDIASMIQFFGMIKGTIRKTNKSYFNFVRIMITKHDGNKAANSIVAMLRKIYGTHVMRAEMFNTQVIKRARAEMKSIYEIEKYHGSKQTLTRAVNIVDSVNKEIEEYIHDAWNNYDIEIEGLEKTNVNVIEKTI